nr:transglutaminase domain-containing protein [uncultured Microbacterium sp.]
MNARAALRRLRELLSALNIWGLGYVLVGIGLATVAAWPLYAAPRALIVGIVGGLLGMLVALVARVLRWNLLLSSLAAAGVYVLAAAPLAVPSSLTSVPAFFVGVRDAVLGVALGWKQILTLNPPLGEYQAVLVPLLVVVLFGSFAATLLVLDPGRRSAWAVAVVSTMSVFGIAFGLIGTSSAVTVWGIELPAPREWVLGISVFLAGLVWLIGRARFRRAQALRIVAAQNVTRTAAPVWLGIRRHLLSGVLLIVALVAGVAVVPAAAQWSDRTVLRDDVEPMVVVQQQISPLSTYRSWFTTSMLDQTVVSVSGDTGDLERIRVATLDSYDGEDFHISPDDRFSRLPRAAAPGGGRVSLEFTVGDAYRGIWVPAPAGLAQAPTFEGARAEQLADGFHVDDEGDTAITIAETSDGREGLEPGDRYEVLVDAPGTAPSLTDVRGGDSLLDSEAYPALAEWATMQELPRTGAGYLEVIDRLRSRGYLSHSLLEDDQATGWITALKGAEGYSFAPTYAGHSAARIEELFAALVEQERRAGADATPEMLVAAVGDDEQFVVAAALLAELWGLESRVVLGARLPAAEEVPGIPACDTECTGANMTAWVEVRSSGGEWAAVDVTPQYALLPSTITEGEQLPEHPTVPEQPRSEALDPPQAQSDSRNTEAPPEDGASDTLATLLAIARVVGLSLLALLLLVLPLLVVVVAKNIRQRSRRLAGDAESRLVGAWEELVDVYADDERPTPSFGTRVQAAAAIDRPAATRLAELVDQGVFAAHPPTEADAEAAWMIVDEERAALAEPRSWWQNVRSHLRLRSFLARVAPRRARASSDDRLAVGTLAMAGAGRQEEDA